MKQYTIKIERTYSTTMQVEANDLNEAQQLFDAMYNSGHVAMSELEQNEITQEAITITPTFKR